MFNYFSDIFATILSSSRLASSTSSSVFSLKTQNLYFPKIRVPYEMYKSFFFSDSMYGQGNILSVTLAPNTLNFFTTQAGTLLEFILSKSICKFSAFSTPRQALSFLALSWYSFSEDLRLQSGLNDFSFLAFFDTANRKIYL